MANPDENIADVWAQTLSILEASPDITPRQIAFIRLAKPLAILDDTVFIAVPTSRPARTSRRASATSW